MYNRQMLNTIQEKNESYFGRIIVLTGARQTGKTTLVKQAFPYYKYISIEDPVTVKEYKNLTASQWESLYPNAILDEIQKEPRMVESIKAVYDQFSNPKYILLGSSQILLLQKIRESLAGRCIILEMFPLTLPEMLTNSFNSTITLSHFQEYLVDNNIVAELPIRLYGSHPQKIQAFKKYLKFGGYPAISDDSISENSKYEWLKNYVKTYLERDIHDLADMRRLEPFTKVQKLVAINTAQVINYSRIASESGITSKTVQKFIEYMNISYQTFVLQPWCRNTEKRLVKSPKVHYMDIGVLRAVLQKRDSLTGHEFETAVISEIYKQAKLAGADLSFYHLRTLDGREVDLLIETENGYIAIEVKQSENVRSVDAKHLRGLENILDKPILKKYVLSNDLSLKDLGDGIVGMSAVQFLT